MRLVLHNEWQTERGLFRVQSERQAQAMQIHAAAQAGREELHLLDRETFEDFKACC
jgi:hypothetical protein